MNTEREDLIGHLMQSHQYLKKLADTPGEPVATSLGDVDVALQVLVEHIKLLKRHETENLGRGERMWKSIQGIGTEEEWGENEGFLKDLENEGFLKDLENEGFLKDLGEWVRRAYEDKS